MATQPHPQPKPQPPPPAPKHEPEPEAARAAHQPPVIGAKPDDPKDPQAAKFEARAAPPRWDEPKEAKALKPDGPTSADEQRERAAEVEKEGLAAYIEKTDQRPDADKPKFEKGALAGGGAFVHGGAQHQVPGVAPPTKRE